jgi:hypothetical protein
MVGEITNMKDCWPGGKKHDQLGDLDLDGNIKTDVKKIRCEGFDWIHLAKIGTPIVGYCK